MPPCQVRGQVDAANGYLDRRLGYLAAVEDAELPGDVVVSRYSRQQATADAHDLLSRGASTDLTTVDLHGSDLGRGAADSEWR